MAARRSALPAAAVRCRRGTRGLACDEGAHLRGGRGRARHRRTARRRAQQRHRDRHLVPGTGEACRRNRCRDRRGTWIASRHPRPGRRRGLRHSVRPHPFRRGQHHRLHGIAHVFNVPTKIARVRAAAYRTSDWADLFARDRVPVDATISPDIEVAEAIARLVTIRASARAAHSAEDRCLASRSNA